MGVSGKVYRGTDQIEARSDVADAGEGSGEVCQKISVRFDRDQQPGDDQDRRPSDEVNAHVVDGGLLDGFALKLDRDDLARVDHLAKIRGGGFDQDQEAGHLDAAGGAARHTARDHQEEQDALGEGGPGIVINGGETRRGRQGKHLEGGVPKRRAEGSDRRGGGIENVCCDGKNRQYDHNDEGDGFLAFKRLQNAARQDQIIQIEVDGEQEHKRRDDHFDVQAVVRSDTCVADAETTRAGVGKRGGHRIENGEFANQKERHFNEGEPDIDRVQNARGASHLGGQLTHVGAGGFRTESVDDAAVFLLYFV